VARRGLGLIDERQVVSPAPHFLEWVRRGLLSGYGADALYRGGLRARTTIDLEWQRAAERAIERHLPRPTDPEAALVAIDPRTGAVRAMVGGRSFKRREFNLATQGRRQAGSAFKPFVLLAALEHGISPLEVRYGPASMTISDPFCETRGRPWVVSNAGDQWAGTMSIERALAGSVNTNVQPRGVDRVTGPGGVVLQSSPGGVDDVGVQVVSPDDALAATRVLEGVLEHGTGTAADLPGRPGAGKTGTAERATDAWFCGYVPQLATCVWVGYPRSATPMRNVGGVPEVYGGTIPAAIWRDFMTEATSGMRVEDFPPGSYELYEDPPPSPSQPPPSPAPEPTAAPAPSPTPRPSPSTEPSPSPSLEPSRSPSPTGAPPPGNSGGGDGGGQDPPASGDP